MLKTGNRHAPTTMLLQRHIDTLRKISGLDVLRDCDFKWQRNCLIDRTNIVDLQLETNFDSFTLLSGS